MNAALGPLRILGAILIRNILVKQTVKWMYAALQKIIQIALNDLMHYFGSTVH